MADLGVWTVEGDAPQSVPRSAQVELEEKLEGWIVANPALLPGDLRIVGRQIRLEGGKLDLLAIDSPDRWVVVEIKRGRLDRGAVAQALDYTSSIEGLPGAALEAKLLPGLSEFGDEATLSRAIREQVEAESGDAQRQVDVMLVGIGAHPRVERIADYLNGFGIQVSVVSFEFFQRDDGRTLLLREVEEPSEPSSEKSHRTIGAIRDRAVEAGVAEQFDRFVGMAEGAGLYVQPVTRSLRFKAPVNHNYTLMFVTPQHGGICVGVRPAAIAKFYPHLREQEVEEALPFGVDGTQLSGAELDACLNQIQVFLKRLPEQDDDSPDEEGDSD